MIQILPKNAGSDNIGSAGKRWNVGYFNNIDLGSNKLVLLIANDENISEGTEPDTMKTALITLSASQSVLVETWGQIKITSTAPTNTNTQVTVMLKHNDTGLKSYDFYNTLLPNGVMTLPFCLSAIANAGVGNQEIKVEIDWQINPNFNVAWTCQCIRCYRV